MNNTRRKWLAEAKKDSIFVADNNELVSESSSVHLIVNVREIKGSCPVYNIGDSIVIRDGYILDTSKSAHVCMHSLASLMPYYVALSRGIPPESLGLSGSKEGVAYLQCLDPCELTGGGTVIFEISVEDKTSP